MSVFFLIMGFEGDFLTTGNSGIFYGIFAKMVLEKEIFRTTHQTKSTAARLYNLMHNLLLLQLFTQSTPRLLQFSQEATASFSAEKSEAENFSSSFFCAGEIPRHSGGSRGGGKGNSTYLAGNAPRIPIFPQRKRKSKLPAGERNLLVEFDLTCKT